MKIFVLCDKDDKETAVSVLKMMKTLSLPSAAYAIGVDWREEKRRLDELLSSSTHLIVVYTERSAADSWLSFVAGYALGTERPMVLYRPSRYPSQSAFLSPFFLVLSLEDLSAFLETERKEWTAIADRRAARRELLELGVSFRGESFADSVREGNSHAVDLFIRAGFPVDARDKKGVPVLCIAAREGNRSITELFLKSGASIDAISEDRGNTALMDAVAGGYAGVVEELLEAGAALDIKSKNGQTALIISVGKNDATLVSMLLAAGADPNTTDSLGFNAYKYAKLFHNPAVVELFDKVVQ